MSTHDTPAIVLEGVTKRYGSEASAALDDVTARVPQGEFVSVMGPSGSGKSTLLHIISGLEVPTTGRVFVDGRDLAGLSDDARSDLRLERIGIVFQNFNLFPSFTVEENVAWPLEFRGVRGRVARGRAHDALERVGVHDSSWGRLPVALSGGEQQRVAVARAMVTEPALLLADEPTGNLDSRNGRAILDLLRGLNREDRLTIVLVTHSTYAATYGQRTIEIEDGRIVRDISAPPEPSARVLPLRK
ncbi:ABC transporter ATP-binding protein [Candidatus Binatia bacterium]|nr:ABC transporter ATP-binding protein [Candidatus Binatia bacterium]